MADNSDNRQNDDSYFTGEWIRKASDTEVAMETCHRNGNFVIWKQLCLKSKAPIQPAQCKKAMEHMYRKVPSLGLCLLPRDGTYWVRRCNNPKVDFEVIEGLTIEEIKQSFFKRKYKSDTGPLFSGRLLLGSTNTCEDPDDLEPDFDHTCYFFFGIPHIFTDGISNMHLVGFFITLLDDVMANRPIDDTVPMGTFKTVDETDSLVLARKELIASNAEIRQKLDKKHEFRTSQKASLVYKFNKPELELGTHSIESIIDQKTSLNFFEVCKKRKVTVNSAFTAAANLCVAEILAENGPVEDDYLVQNFLIVTVRRYWEYAPADVLGCHYGGPQKVYTKTPRNLDGEKFWEYTRELHESIKNGVITGDVLEDPAYHDFIGSISPYCQEFLLSDKEYKGDYVGSNVLDVTPVVTEGGTHVRCTHVIRACTVHLYYAPLFIFCHTFRGRFIMSFAYNAAALRKDVIEKFSSKLKEKIKMIGDQL